MSDNGTSHQGDLNAGSLPLLADGWCWAKVSEALTLIDYRGRTPPYSDNGIPHLRSANVRNGKIIWEKLRYVSEDAYSTYMTRGFPCKGDVLFTTEAPLGEVALAPEEKFCLAQRLIIIRPPLECVGSRFLMYQIMGTRFQSFLQLRGTGSTVTGISSRNFKLVPICIAPRKEQERIADKIEELFSDLDAGVAALERAKANLKRYRAAVLKAAVEGRLTEQWRADNPDVEPASQLLERILQKRRKKWEAAELEKRKRRGDSAQKLQSLSGYEEPLIGLPNTLPELPPSWTWTTLDSLTYFTVDYRGKTPPTSESGIPIISAANVKNGRIVVNKPRWVSKDTYDQWTVRGLPQPGDLIVTTEAPVAEFALYPNEGTYLLTRRVFACQTASIDNRYLMFCLRSSTAQKHIEAHLRGSTVPRILKPDLLSTPIPLPPLEEQRQIAAEIEKQISVIHAIDSQLEKNESRANRLRQSILKRAFEGKLVPQDQNDEPAIQLLERIRSERRKLDNRSPSNNKNRKRQAKKPAKRKAEGELQ